MASRPGSFRPSILLVDADDDTRTLHKVLLEGTAARIEEACDGADAYGRALSRPPDLVVTELRLPRIDGRTLIGRLRSDPRFHDCAILVVASSVYGLVREDLFDVGADEVMLKPCEPDAFIETVRRLTFRQLRIVDSYGSARPDVATALEVLERFDPGRAGSGR
jgi:CheY-like chemotaxis protein